MYLNSVKFFQAKERTTFITHSISCVLVFEILGKKNEHGNVKVDQIPLFTLSM